MQERLVSIDRETYPLPANFTVFATQNPIEYEGTYPLPEAQKDRFMFKIVMRSPERADELALAGRMLGTDSPEQTLASVEPCIQKEELAELKLSLNDVLIREELIAYLVDVVRKTRAHESVLVGAGPRATQALLLASRAHAAIQGRDFVTPDDIRAMALARAGASLDYPARVRNRRPGRARSGQQDSRGSPRPKVKNPVTGYSIPDFMRNMIVPSSRLLVLVGVVAMPAAVLAILPGFAALGYGLIGLLVAMPRSMHSQRPRRLDGIEVAHHGRRAPMEGSPGRCSVDHSQPTPEAVLATNRPVASRRNRSA